jgi:phosphate transport system permease protein
MTTTTKEAFRARTRRSLARRKSVNGFMVGLIILAAVLATVPLIVITFYLLKFGAGSVQWHFFTNMPKPVGEEGGGMANAIIGTILIVGLSSLLGLPVGIGAGLYLAEHRGTALANTVRFLSDVLNGLPSIVMGIFAWQFLVRPLGHFSAWAGGVALGAMMIPMVARTTEEMVQIVPVSLREAASPWATPAGAPRSRSCCGPRAQGS